jgi:hypothetical protein
MDRRLFLSSLGATAVPTFAGCGQTVSDRGGSETKNGATVEATRHDSGTPESPAIPLPGDPVRTRNAALDIQDVSGLFESESRGFDGDSDEYEFETEPQASFEQSGVDAVSSDNSVDLEVSADHVGTGRAFGLATGSFQTAWEAPTMGQYRLSSSYSRHANILYDNPDEGRVSASFDASLLAIRYREGEVISKRTHPELQHKNGGMNEELAEWFISKGVTYLIGTALGLGLVARIVLGQIIGELVELNQNIGNSESQIYDVSHRVQPNSDDPIQLTTEFEATEGEVFIFELTPTLGVGFELQDSWWYQPTSIASVDSHPFHIERLG